jgi:hypothetical protein
MEIGAPEGFSAQTVYRRFHAVQQEVLAELEAQGRAPPPAASLSPWR